MTSRLPAVLRVLLPLSLVGYAVVALALRHWWLSGAAAPVVAWLLWRRHPRARFSAYVLLSVMAARGALTQSWATLAYAAAAIVALQLAAAADVWPRLAPRRRRRRVE